MNTFPLVEQYEQATYPVHSVVCPRHGLQPVTNQSHEQPGTKYLDGSYNTRWHTVTACGCVFDIFYSRVYEVRAATVTIYEERTP